MQFEMEMPVNAYMFFLKSAACDEPILLPKHCITNENTAEQYLQAQNLWVREKWMELDLDCVMHPTHEVARILYNLTHMRAVLRWARLFYKEYFVRGPVDFLYVLEKDGRVQLKLVSNTNLLRRIQYERVACLEGALRTKRMSDGKERASALLGETEDALQEELIMHLQLLYEDAIDA